VASFDLRSALLQHSCTSLAPFLTLSDIPGPPGTSGRIFGAPPPGTNWRRGLSGHRRVARSHGSGAEVRFTRALPMSPPSPSPPLPPPSLLSLPADDQKASSEYRRRRSRTTGDSRTPTCGLTGKRGRSPTLPPRWRKPELFQGAAAWRPAPLVATSPRDPPRPSGRTPILRRTNRHCPRREKGDSNSLRGSTPRPGLRGEAVCPISG